MVIDYDSWYLKRIGPHALQMSQNVVVYPSYCDPDLIHS